MKNLKTKMMAIVMAFAFIGIAVTGCKNTPKDEDLKAAIEKILHENPGLSAAEVTVEKGVATLSGQVNEDSGKEGVAKEVAAVPGVKSVVNNLTVKVNEIPIAADHPLAAAVKDATKDYPTVTATVVDGVVMLKGEIQKANLQKLMIALNALRPKRIENAQLVIK